MNVIFIYDDAKVVFKEIMRLFSCLILYAKYADCLSLLNFLMKKEWRNKEITKEKLTDKRKEKERKESNKRKERKKQTIKHPFLTPSICFSAPNRAWTYAPRFTVVGLNHCATNAW